MTEYYLEREIIEDNFRAKIFRPILTDEERERRVNEVKDALMHYGKAMQDAERKAQQGTA